MRRLNQEKKVTIVLITHYMEETVDADRIIVMDQGKIVMDGTPRQVFTEVESLKRIRMDVPEVTELAWKLKQAGMPLPDGVLTRAELVTILKKLLPKQAEFAPDFVKDAPEHLEITDPILRVEKLSHIYQQGTAMESYALRDLNFEVQRGIVTAVIGHTGSGKSTLTQHLNGLLRGSEGDILYRFRDGLSKAQQDNVGGTEGAGKAGGQADRDFVSIYSEGFDMKGLRFKVGLVFQYPEYQLFEVDVITDVMFGPKNQGLSEEEARSRAEQALRRVGLSEDNWKKSPFELSGGQKRRVAIAGVLAMEPEILILDEPTAGLDPAGRDDLFRQIQALHEEAGMTILLVSHSMDDVARYAKDILVLDHGELKMHGTPQEVFRRYKELEEMGLGAPQMIYLIHELKDVGIRFRERPGTVDEMAAAVLHLYQAAGGVLQPAAAAGEAGPKTLDKDNAGKEVQ